MEDSQLRLSLRSLAVFRGIADREPLVSLTELLDACIDARHPSQKIRCWARYAASLLPYGCRLENALRHYLADDRNICVRNALAGVEQRPLLLSMMDQELSILEAACQVSPSDMRIYVDYGEGSPDGYLPLWVASSPDLRSAYHDMLAKVRGEGFGAFRTHHMFVLRHGRIVPVANPDPVRLSDLQGYSWQRETVLANIRALLSGGPAANMLLYGDSGTGKSSTLKAVANEMHPEGLRLVEVRPSQLHHLPNVLERLADNPLRFMIFIDDLSFSVEDDNFRALKGILEGSVLGRAANVIVCATSNRRHLIKEAFSDRMGDDVHVNETIQQTTALSDRFGLAIPFMNPKKDVYLQMVAADARRAGVEIGEDELFAGAERFALQKGGRSGRAAHQYVDQLKAGILD